MTDPANEPDAVDRDPVIDQMEDDGADKLAWRVARDAKFRLDRHLQSKLKGMSRHQIQRLITLGGVTVNGQRTKPAAKLKQGDHVCVIVPPRGVEDLKPEPIPLHVLHEEPGFIVINKQANLIVHPARSHLSGTLLNGLLYHFQNYPPQAADEERSDESGGQSGGRPADRPTLSSVGQSDTRPGVIHRLDKNTTGVIVFAKRDDAHWAIARQFEDRTNLKAYLALVHGCPDQPYGAIQQPIGKHPTIREAYCVRHDSHGKASLTLYRVRRRYKGYSLIELELKTGRTHQIRVHLSYIGNPIVGDIIYGGEPVGPPEITEPPRPAGARANLTYARTKEQGEALAKQADQRDDMIMATPALHAALLQIKHPDTGQPITFTASLHEPLRTLVHTLEQHPAPGPVCEKGYHVDLDAALGS